MRRGPRRFLGATLGSPGVPGGKTLEGNDRKSLDRRGAPVPGGRQYIPGPPRPLLPRRRRPASSCASPVRKRSRLRPRRSRRTSARGRASQPPAPPFGSRRARLPHSVNVPKRTFTECGLLRPPNGAWSNEQPSEPARIVDVERQKDLTPHSSCLTAAYSPASRAPRRRSGPPGRSSPSWRKWR